MGFWMKRNVERCRTHNINTFTSTLGVAVLNDHIYAVGGFDGSCGLNTAEVMVEHGDQDDEEKQTIGNYPNYLEPVKGFGHVGRWNPRVEKHREYEHKAQQCWCWSSPGRNCTTAFGQYIYVYCRIIA